VPTPPPITVLSVTASRRIRTATRELARRGPWAAQTVSSLSVARRFVSQSTVALLVLDARSARREALWLRTLRSDGFRRPIVWVRANRRELSTLLRAGADDAIPNGVRGAELTDRLARFLEAHAPVLSVGPIELEPRALRVRVHGRSIALTPREHALLLLLLTRAGQVVDKDAIGGVVLLEQGDCRNVYFHIHNLKQKLGAAGVLIESVRGEGYRLIDG
jgi:two-component system, OmpR family, response regulator TctD